MHELEKILILDYGSQYTQLIARRIREMNVFSEILPPDTPLETLMKVPPKGIILSGGPQSTQAASLSCDPALLNTDIPILGICYGMQLMNVLNDGTVSSSNRGEYGKQTISVTTYPPLFHELEAEELVWMSHGDSIDRLAPCFTSIAKSQSGLVAAIQHRSRPQYGVQFHPEVTHTKNGNKILQNFIKICACSQNWSIQNYIEEAKNQIRERVGNGRVVSLVSGGVDSTAATFLCYEALGSDKVYPLHIDSGLMREGETQEVQKLLEKHGMSNLVIVDASEEFLKALEGVAEPETKRKIIGELFITILDREIEKLEGKTFFCQGTLYTDLIESGKGCGKHADVIKSHHNVNPPIVEKKRQQELIIEPNSRIFKDEVRRVCEALKLPAELIWRHPFPGPGLAIRILGEITGERLQTLRQADKIFIEEIRRAGLYDKIWQAFAVLLPVSTVGVMGDKRTVGNVIAIRAVSSLDGMTCEFSTLPMDLLGLISTRIINEVPDVNRVVYDITSKPPGTIEWE
ncbi:MAG: glutamine-hydrolyzing GMP synthase [Waddliaceae bacterium]